MKTTLIKKVNLPFSEFLKQRLGDYYHGVNLLVQSTALLGKPISARTINRYLHSDTSPSLDNALILMKALNLEVPIEELQKSIELEKTKQFEFNLAYETFERHVRFSKKDFNEKFKIPNTMDLKDVVDKRVKELYPNKKGAFSLYIRDLIVKDLKENLIYEE